MLCSTLVSGRTPKHACSSKRRMFRACLYLCCWILRLRNPGFKEGWRLLVIEINWIGWLESFCGLPHSFEELTSTCGSVECVVDHLNNIGHISWRDNVVCFLVAAMACSCFDACYDAACKRELTWVPELMTSSTCKRVPTNGPGMLVQGGCQWWRWWWMALNYYFIVPLQLWEKSLYPIP